MLSDAARLGIVEIQIHDPRSYSSSLGDAVADALGLRRAVVVQPPSDPAHLIDRLGQASMELLASLATPHMTIGLSWSRTLDAAARYLPSLAPCTVVQLVGALQLRGSQHLLQVLARLDGTPGTHTWPLYTPLVVDESSTAIDLRRQPEIAETLAHADQLDLAMVAIGAWTQGESTVWAKVDENVRRAAGKAGAIAEISGRLLDRDGKPVHTDLDKRTIGVSVEQLVQTPEVIAVARGASRADAVRAAVRSGIVTSLVIDSALAEAILASES
nr:sugar-binding domain-containing protein [Spelaeicoccus albus]